MPPTLFERLLALTPRERLFIGVGVLATLLFLLFMLLPDSEAEVADEGGVEIVDTPPPAAAAVPAAPVAFVPSPPPPAPAPAAAAPAASPGGLALKSVLARGAILRMPTGNERLVPLGREFMPGVTLKEVGVLHAIVGGPGGDMRLELGRTGGDPVPGQSIAPAPPVASPAAAGSDHRQATTRFRLGLQPVKTDGRVTAHAIKPGSSLPELERAGLKPGDVILRVNGSGFNEERLMELSWEIANSTAVEVEYLRGGRRMKTNLKPQQ